MKMNTKKFNYKIYPPYVDAYLACRGDKSEMKTLKEIEVAMRHYAAEWGEASVGRAILRGEDVPVLFNGKAKNCSMARLRMVVCCASVWEPSIDGKVVPPSRSFLLVTRGKTAKKRWWENTVMVEAPIKEGWNVT